MDVYIEHDNGVNFYVCVCVYERDVNFFLFLLNSAILSLIIFILFFLQSFLNFFFYILRSKNINETRQTRKINSQKLN